MHIPSPNHAPRFQLRIRSGKIWRLLLFLLAAPCLLPAQYQKAPPDFGDTYQFPTPIHPEPIANYLRNLDVGLLALALGIAGWLVYKSRNRKGMILLSLCSVAYFGFYRKGCICSVGAIQNVVLCLVNPQYFISISVIVIFFLPLIATLFFGRIFCSGVCPLGAIQDLLVVRPLRVPVKLDKALSWLQYVYLGLAVLFAGWGLQMHLGSWHINLGQRFLICDWDPFIPIFRRTGPFHMVAIAGVFLIAGMFIGRPYCRWLCPYGGILAMLSRVSWKNIRISPSKELDCGLCADACPYGAIHELRADRGSCLACTRCYDSCPQQKKWVALRTGPQKKISAVTAPRPWESLARSWIGPAAGFVVLLSLGWMLATYVRTQHVIPGEKVLIESLKEKSKTDAEIQKVLQPELLRQQQAAAARRQIYHRGGWILIFSAAVLIAWLAGFRPKQGMGSGLPKGILKFIEKPSAPKKTISRKPQNDPTSIE
jgi:polyferredoxin